MKIDGFKPTKWENKRFSIEYKEMHGVMQYVLFDKKESCLVGFNTDLEIILSFLNEK